MDLDKLLNTDDDIENQKLWYAITTFSTHEHKVLEDLKRKLIANQQHGDIVDDCFIAEREEVVTVEGKNGEKKKKAVTRNMTPGYIYIKMKMTDDAWFTIRNTPSVSGFVGSHGKKSKPVPIPDSQMLPVLEYCGRTDIMKTLRPYKIGETVEILSGPFKGKHGKITGFSKDNTVANIDAVLLGQTVKVEINVSEIHKYK